MTKPMIRIHNTETDEIIEREMTNEEFSNHKNRVTQLKAEKVEAELKETARQAIADRLGLTADELKLLLG
jgi:hypothetical protein